MVKAIWNGKVIAEAEKFEKVEGNVYFPPESLKQEFFSESLHKTTCFWKGVASYYDLSVDGKDNKDAAWYYPKPSNKAKNIEKYVAFWKGVKIVD